MEKKFAQIAIPLAVTGNFTYSIPDEFVNKIKIGHRVKINFGKKTILGFVVDFIDNCELKNIKQIIDIVDDEPIFNFELLKTLKWISEYYVAPFGEVLKTALPKRMCEKILTPKTEKGVFIDENLKEILNNTATIKNNQKQSSLLNFLNSQENKFVSLSEISSNTNFSSTYIKTFLQKLNLQISEEISFPKFLRNIHKTILNIQLNQYQQNSTNEILKKIDENIFHTFLLFGITGSGKTQVYIEATKKVLEKNKTVIFLVPEISLTHQIVSLFQNNFGKLIGVIHSKMSDGERLNVWNLAKTNKIKIIIGPRSAIFSPFQNLGLLIVDEEHETSYKQYDMTPRYNARDVAIVRAKENNAIVILGSATPSLESFFNFQTKKYTILKLPERVDNFKLPKISIVDMKNSKNKNTTSFIFSLPLIEKINERLNKKESVILLQNRRGFSSFIECINCGHIEKCKNCSLTLTYHKNDSILLCHYCGYKIIKPLFCNSCGFYFSRFKGFGTERIEEELSKIFPIAKIQRMDIDSISRKNFDKNVLEKFANGEIDILIGTQIVAKGFNFPKVSLVGVVSSDMQMYMPDFRASEKTFQLLTQVAGRSGRSNIEGEVIIQTYNPENSCLQFVKKNDTIGYLNFELQERKILFYPPFSRIALIEFLGKNENEVFVAINEFKKHISLNESLIILGPSKAVIERKNQNFRFHILIKSRKKTDASGKILRQTILNALNSFKQTKYFSSKYKIIIDIDPTSMM